MAAGHGFRGCQCKEGAPEGNCALFLLSDEEIHSECGNMNRRKPGLLIEFAVASSMLSRLPYAAGAQATVKGVVVCRATQQG